MEQCNAKKVEGLIQGQHRRVNKWWAYLKVMRLLSSRDDAPPKLLIAYCESNARMLLSYVPLPSATVDHLYEVFMPTSSLSQSYEHMTVLQVLECETGVKDIHLPPSLLTFCFCTGFHTFNT